MTTTGENPSLRNRALSLLGRREHTRAELQRKLGTHAEDPQEVMKYYFSDRRRLSEVEALVLEENVVNYVLEKAKVTDKPVSFDELMANNAQG